MGTTDIPDLQSHTIAWFDSSDQVRAAESALERSGVESHYIEVARPSTARTRREVDRKTWSSIGTRGIIGLVVGIAAGALVGFLVGLLLGYEGTDLFAWAFGGAIFSAVPGAFYMVGSRMPTQEQAFDTYGGEGGRRDAMWIAIGGPDDVQSHAAEVLQAQHPSRIDGHAA
jgi:hypothetical protein